MQTNRQSVKRGRPQTTMTAGQFRRSTHLDVLKGIGRNLLVRLLAPFAADLASRSICLPNPTLGNTDFFHQAAAIFSSPEGLPDSLKVTLCAIAEMATLAAPTSTP